MAAPSGLSKDRLILLAVAAALGSLATQMLVPALPAAATDLRTDAPTIQLAISLYLFGLGVGQVVCGPLADSLGRKKVLVGGIVLFAIGSLLAALSLAAWQLLAVRILQALGASATLLGARAIIADSLGPDRTAGGIAALMAATLLSPMIGPWVGGVVVALAGWRSIFWTLAAAAALVALLTGRLLHETLAAPGVRFRLGWVVSSYAGLLRQWNYLRCVLANALVVSSLYVFLTASPFLLIGRFGFTPDQAGLYYLVVAAASLLGTACVSVLERSGTGLRLGIALSTTGAAVMLALVAAGISPPYAMLTGMLFVGAGAGITTPMAIARAMAHAPAISGTASSLAAAVQMLGCALTTALVAALHLERPASLAIAILTLTGAGLLLAPKR